MKDILFYSVKLEELYEYVNFIKILSENGYNLFLTTEEYFDNSNIDCYFKTTHYDINNEDNIKYCFIVNINNKKKFDQILNSFFTIIIYNHKYFSNKLLDSKKFFLENSNYILNFYDKLKFDDLRNYKMPYFSSSNELFKKNTIKEIINIYIPNNYNTKLLKKFLLFIDKNYNDKFKFIINDIDNPFNKEDIELRNFKLKLTNHEMVKFVSKSSNSNLYLAECNFTLILSEFINVSYLYDSFVLGKPLIVLEESNINCFTHDPNSYLILKYSNNKNFEKSIEEILNYNIDYSKIIHNYYNRFNKTKFIEVLGKLLIELEKK